MDLCVLDQPGLQSRFQDSQNYPRNPVSKRKQNSCCFEVAGNCQHLLKDRTQSLFHLVKRSGSSSECLWGFFVGGEVTSGFFLCFCSFPKFFRVFLMETMFYSNNKHTLF